MRVWLQEKNYQSLGNGKNTSLIYFELLEKNKKKKQNATVLLHVTFY